jgi:hypothetical protein
MAWQHETTVDLHLSYDITIIAVLHLPHHFQKPNLTGHRRFSGAPTWVHRLLAPPIPGVTKDLVNSKDIPPGISRPRGHWAYLHGVLKQRTISLISRFIVS